MLARVDTATEHMARQAKNLSRQYLVVVPEDKDGDAGA